MSPHKRSTLLSWENYSLSLVPQQCYRRQKIYTYFLYKNRLSEISRYSLCVKELWHAVYVKFVLHANKRITGSSALADFQIRMAAIAPLEISCVKYKNGANADWQLVWLYCTTTQIKSVVAGASSFRMMSERRFAVYINTYSVFIMRMALDHQLLAFYILIQCSFTVARCGVAWFMQSLHAGKAFVAGYMAVWMLCLLLCIFFYCARIRPFQSWLVLKPSSDANCIYSKKMQCTRE